MEHDEKFWLIMIGIVAAVVVTLVLGGCALYNRHNEKMAELGYQLETVAGSDFLVWRKAGGQ